jgi:hypothetical protein
MERPLKVRPDLAVWSGLAGCGERASSILAKLQMLAISSRREIRERLAKDDV